MDDDDEGKFNVRDALRRSLNKAIKDFDGSRFEIAGAMSHLLGVEVTKAMIDSWTAESKLGNPERTARFMTDPGRTLYTKRCSIL